MGRDRPRIIGLRPTMPENFSQPVEIQKRGEIF